MLEIPGPSKELDVAKPQDPRSSGMLQNPKTLKGAGCCKTLDPKGPGWVENVHDEYVEMLFPPEVFEDD